MKAKEKAMEKRWVRVCQECLHVQEDKPATSNRMTSAYLNRKCKKCKSEALDYGRWEGPATEVEE